MNNLTEILTIEEYNRVINDQVIMVFSTTWCPDCHFLKTFIDELVNDNPKWKFYYVDRDKLIDLCIDLEILGIPSFIAYKNGTEVSRFVNKFRKTKEQIQTFIDEIE